MKDIDINFLNDMHLENKNDFLNYYSAMQSRDINLANSIIDSKPEMLNQMTDENSINAIIEGTNILEITPKEDIDYFLDNLSSEFQNMIDNTKIMGIFDENTQYYPHNFVYYNNKGYYANIQPPIGTLPTDTEYWIEYDIKGFQGYGGINNINLKFNWDSTVNYNKGDIVIFKNRLWCAIDNNINSEPNLNHYPWIIITLPQLPNKAYISKSQPYNYNIGDFWFKIIQGEDVISTTWGMKQPQPTPRFGSANFIIGQNVYVTGGILSTFARTNKNEMFDTLTSTWSEKAPMNNIRARHASFSIGDKGYCIGGIGEDGSLLNTVEEYDSSTNSWVAKNNYPIAISASGTSYNSIGYVIGGENSNIEALNSCYSYNASNDEWTAIENKIIPTYGNAIIADSGNIYSVGGIDNNGNVIGDVEVYNISNNTWEKKSAMSLPRAYLGLFNKGGYIYAVGGLDSDWYSLNSNEKYSIENDEWEVDMPMNYARSSLTTAIVGTKAYAIGGIDIGISNVGGYVEQYDAIDAVSDFEMIIDTNLGTNTVSIPMVESGNYNFYIDWGDGSISPQIKTYNDENATHTYSENGEYTIKIMGICSILKFSDNIATVLKEVTKNILTLSDVNSMFKDCINLTNISSSLLNNSPNINNVDNLFSGCSNLEVIPVSLFDNNINIASAKNTFLNCSKITNIPTGLFNNQSNILDFTDCFNGCSALTSIPSSLFNSNMSASKFVRTFANCASITTIPNQLFSNVSYATDMSELFLNCTGIETIPSGLFNNQSNVNSFNSTFKGCTNLSNIPDALFRNCLSVSDYSEVFLNTEINNISNYCFNGNNATLNNFINLENLISIENYAFLGVNLSTLQLYNCTNLATVGNNIFSNSIVSVENLLSGCTALQSIGNQDFTNVNNYNSFLSGSSDLSTISGFLNNSNQPTIKADIDFSTNVNLSYNSLINIINSLVSLEPNNKKTITLGNENLSKLKDEEKLLIINKNWNLSGYSVNINSEVASSLVTLLYPDYTETSTAVVETPLYFIVDREKNNTNYKFLVDKVSGIVYLEGTEPIKEYNIQYTLTKFDTPFTEYISKTSSNDTDGSILKSEISRINGGDPSLLKTISFVKNYNSDNTTGNVTNFEYMFENCTSLISISGLNVSNASNLKGMFSECNSLLTVNDLDASNATDMSYMFAGCNVMKTYPQISNTSKVTNMESMFERNWEMVTAPTLDTSSVESTKNMFSNCIYLTNIPAYNVSNVVDASYMFSDHVPLTTLPTLQFSSCLDASYIFSDCETLTSMPSTVSFSKVQNVEGMFSGCSGITSIRTGYFPNTIQNASHLFQGTGIVNVPTDATKVFGTNNNLTNVSYMFSDCKKLKTIGTHTIATLNNNTGGTNINSTALNNQLFRYCPNILDMSHICEGCSALGNNTDFPQGLFYWCPKVTDISYAFSGCTGITNTQMQALNEVLFVNNTELVNISYLFQNAGNTSGVIYEKWGSKSGSTIYEQPILLFPNSTKIEDASYCFSGFRFSGSAVTLPFVWKSKVLKNVEGYFKNIGRSWIYTLAGAGDDYMVYSYGRINEYAPALENCSQMFYKCSGLVAEGLPTVNAFKKITTLKDHSAFFYGCSSLSDFSSIPADWKSVG